MQDASMTPLLEFIDLILWHLYDGLLFFIMMMDYFFMMIIFIEYEIEFS